MELKKNESLDLEKKKPLFFNVGLVLALTAVIVAFNWKGEMAGVELSEQPDPFDEIYQVPLTAIPEPEPPQPKAATPGPVANNQPPIIVASELPESVKNESIIIDADPNIDVDLSAAFSDVPIEDVPEGPVDIVEHMPTFPGGMDAFYNYVSKNIEFPRKAKFNNVSGKVFVQFIIDKDGTVTDVKAIKGIGFGCDEAAIEVLENSPKWNPGKQRGRAVKVRMVLPITFRLN